MGSRREVLGEAFQGDGQQCPGSAWVLSSTSPFPHHLAASQSPALAGEFGDHTLSSYQHVPRATVAPGAQVILRVCGRKEWLCGLGETADPCSLPSGYDCYSPPGFPGEGSMGLSQGGQGREGGGTGLHCHLSRKPR